MYAYECVMSYIWMRHITHTNASCHTYEYVRASTDVNVRVSDESCHTYECVMSYMWMFHVTHTNASCHTYECVGASTDVNVRVFNGPCHRYERVMSLIWMRHVTDMNTSRHTYDCLMSHIWMRQGFYWRQRRSFRWIMSHIWMRHMNAAGLLLTSTAEFPRSRFDNPSNVVAHSSDLLLVQDSENRWRVVSHIWMSHVTLMDESYHKYACGAYLTTSIHIRGMSLHTPIPLPRHGPTLACVSHAPCWWVTSQCHGPWLCLWYTNESCSVWMLHISYKW